MFSRARWHHSLSEKRAVLHCGFLFHTRGQEHAAHRYRGCEAWVCSVSLVYQKETLEIEEEEGIFTLRPKETKLGKTQMRCAKNHGRKKNTSRVLMVDMVLKQPAYLFRGVKLEWFVSLFVNVRLCASLAILQLPVCQIHISILY